MMRRGGRGSTAQAPGRGLDGPIPSGVRVGWGAGNYGKVMVLAGCSIALSTIFWSLRSSQEPHPLGHNLQPRNSGFVFPLYRSYQQFRNGSHVGRKIRSSQEPKALFELRGGRRTDDGLEIEEFYIKMELGDPATPFHFHIDTASGPVSWVYCNDLGRYGSFLNTWGPNGRFVPEGNSFVKCTGPTASVCLTLQAAGKQKCNRKHNFDCLFATKYFDGSTYSGRVVNESITFPMRDKTEQKTFALFGCAFETEGDTETVPLITDGVIGLGNCKGTLMDQLVKSNLISHNVLGVCLAKEMRTAAPVGFISLGMDFQEKFVDSVSNWVKLLNQPGVLCAYGAKLLYIYVDQERITVRFSHNTVGMAMYLDTGSDLTFLQKDVYDQVLNALDIYATNRAYVRKKDNEYLAASEQRLCWEPPSKKRRTRGKSMRVNSDNFRVRSDRFASSAFEKEETEPKSSPYQDFGPLKLGFEGMEGAPLPYLIIQPVNYLVWDEDEIKLCVNILQDTTNSVSNLGADIMRENLYVFDVENQRVRWTASTNCDI